MEALIFTIEVFAITIGIFVLAMLFAWIIIKFGGGRGWL